MPDLPLVPEIEELSTRMDAIREAVSRAVVGQREPVEEILAALLVGGHVLLQGVPGVAKTLLARSISAALGLEFRRIQFTPDLMPADVTGTQVFDFRQGVFHVQKGPVFTQVLLADEINRTPPKTQAALLEAMQERQVTLDGRSLALPEPFFVMATQNPLDHEGTYPLPEAQLDRFLVRVEMGYPADGEEAEIHRRFLAGTLHLETILPAVPAVLDASRILAARAVLDRVHVDERVLAYLRLLLQATRSSRHLITGASPRAGIALLAMARSWAALEGRAFALPDDFKRMARPVLRHRLAATPEAELDGFTVDKVLDRVLDDVKAPR